MLRFDVGAHWAPQLPSRPGATGATRILGPNEIFDGLVRAERARDESGVFGRALRWYVHRALLGGLTCSRAPAVAGRGPDQCAGALECAPCTNRVLAATDAALRPGFRALLDHEMLDWNRKDVARENSTGHIRHRLAGLAAGAAALPACPVGSAPPGARVRDDRPPPRGHALSLYPESHLEALGLGGYAKAVAACRGSVGSGSDTPSCRASPSCCACDELIDRHFPLQMPTVLWACAPKGVHLCTPEQARHVIERLRDRQVERFHEAQARLRKRELDEGASACAFA